MARTDEDAVIELLRARPSAALAFWRPSVEHIVGRALRNGVVIYGDTPTTTEGP